mgnify:FL=1
MDKDTYFVRSLGCQWLGADYDPRKHSDRLKPTPYCGCKELVGESMYCAEHYARMYVKGSALRKRKKDIARAQQLRDLESLFNEAVAELESEGYNLELQSVDEALA